MQRLTQGNDKCHVILRGSNAGPNYAKEHVEKAAAALEKASLPARIMIDCSHGNSEKKHQNQVHVVESVADQLAQGDANAWNLVGVMLESHLEEGKQNIPASGPQDLKYGQSITDGTSPYSRSMHRLGDHHRGPRKAPRRCACSPR